jgi:hypothetical protein
MGNDKVAIALSYNAKTVFFYNGKLFIFLLLQRVHCIHACQIKTGEKTNMY